MVAFPIHDIGDPSAVLRYTATSNILVLYWSSIILYTLICINETVAPEFIRALNLFPSWTFTVGQSETSPIVNWLVDDSPLHSFRSLSLLIEASNSLRGQIHCLIWGRVWLWILNCDLLLVMRFMRGFCLWKQSWCFHVYSLLCREYGESV